MEWNVWTLALFWGLMKARLGFFHSEMDRDKTLESQQNSFDFASGTTTKSYHQTTSSRVGLLECFPCDTTRIPLLQQHDLIYHWAQKAGASLVISALWHLTHMKEKVPPDSCGSPHKWTLDEYRQAERKGFLFTQGRLLKQLRPVEPARNHNYSSQQMQLENKEMSHSLHWRCL